MFLVFLAVISSAVSFLTGIIAVGSGQHFQYEWRDILSGRRDALLYVWVTFSSIFALVQTAAFINYSITYHGRCHEPDQAVWMVLHAGLALLLTFAHLFIRGDLQKGQANSIYLWGPRSHAD